MTITDSTIIEIQQYAGQHHGGRLEIRKTYDGWKAAFGLANYYWENGEGQWDELPAHETLAEALTSLLESHPSFSDPCVVSDIVFSGQAPLPDGGTSEALPAGQIIVEGLTGKVLGG